MPASAATMFDINGLKAIKAELIDLPPKPKTQYALMEAESFLHKRVHSVLKRNYTVAELSTLFLRAGWSEDQIKLFWKFYERRESKCGHKKTTLIKVSSKKIKAIVHKDDPQKNPSQFIQKNSVENTHQNGSLSAQSAAESQQPQSGAHFELSPDTDDI